jgi:hypothetical protein
VATCLARAQLFDTLDDVAVQPFDPLPGNVVLKANVEALVRTWVVPADPAKKLVAAVLEFDLTGPSGTVVRFRTFATPTPGQYGAWDDPVPSPHPTYPHVRGWWPKSAILVTMPFGTFNANPIGGSAMQFASVCDEQCIEHDNVTPLSQPGTGFGALTSAGHEYDLTNKGCYGANLEYDVRVWNDSTNLAGYVHAALVARNVDAFFGAAHVADPGGTGADKRFVPRLLPPNAQGKREMVDLLQARPGNRIVVPDGTAQVGPNNFRLRLATGGACSTPVNIVISREPLE